MFRYALKIEYCGAGFAGWQRQKGPFTVQQAVEDALRKLDPGVPSIVAAGRTDSGVHARGQVVHCDLSRKWDEFRLGEALNAHLRPLPVAILKASPVQNEFSARFSARERCYQYVIVSRRAPLALKKGRAWHLRNKLDIDAMREGAACLVGNHDFSTFRSAHCQSDSPVKTLDAADIGLIEIPHGVEFRFNFRARSFLHRQVRSMVGTLERVGAGAWHPRDVKSALEARRRGASGPVAPAEGLYLQEVKYSPDPFAG